MISSGLGRRMFCHPFNGKTWKIRQGEVRESFALPPYCDSRACFARNS